MTLEKNPTPPTTKSKTSPQKRWETESECLKARHVAAYTEAREAAGWPIIVRVGLRAPEGDPPDTEIELRRAELFGLGAAVMAKIVPFQAAWRKLEALEANRLALAVVKLRPAARELHARTFPTKPTQARVDPIDDAIRILALRAGFARRELEGNASLSTKGRPPEPARGRVAGRYALGWTDLSDGKRWRPTARDLALLAICEGANILPNGWEKMAVAMLIDREERAMRPYLKATGKK
jgi:hypothetical protein